MAAKQYKVGFRVRAVNRLMKQLVNRGKTGSWLLTTIGRKSGERRTVPVTPVEVGGERYIVAPYGAVAWVQNIRAEPKASISHGGASTLITAEEVTGGEAGRALAKYYRENEKYVGDYMDIPGDKTGTDFNSVTYLYPVFRVVSR